MGLPNCWCDSWHLTAHFLLNAIQNRVVRHVNSCFFTMVAVDAADKKPAHVTPLAPSTPDEIRRHAAAELRKQMRREMEQRFTATRTGS